MQHFNPILDVIVAQATKLLKEWGLSAKGHWVMRYVDDVLVGSPSEHGHEDALKSIFFVLQSHGWIVTSSKGQWLTGEVEFLGTKVTVDGIQPHKGMFLKLQDLKIPRNKQELRVFLGLCIQLITYQYCQFDILKDMQKYKTTFAPDFMGTTF